MTSLKEGTQVSPSQCLGMIKSAGTSRKTSTCINEEEPSTRSSSKGMEAEKKKSGRGVGTSRYGEDRGDY